MSRCNRCGEDTDVNQVVCNDCIQHMDAIKSLNEIHGVYDDEDEYIAELIEDHAQADFYMNAEVAYSDQRN